MSNKYSNKKGKVLSKNSVAYILICILLFHTVILDHFFPITLLFDDDIIVTYDYPQKLYDGMKSKDLLLDFQIKGYDPQLNKGTGILYQSDKLFSLVAFLLFFVPVEYLFKYFVFIVLLLSPLLFYYIGRNFRLNRKASLILVSLSVVVLNFDFMICGMRYWGLYLYIVSMILSLLAFSYLYKNISSLTFLKICKYSSICLLSICCHVLSVIPLLIFSLIIFLFKFDKTKIYTAKYSLIKKFSFFLLLIVLLFFANIFLLKPFGQYKQYYSTPNPGEAKSEGFDSLIEDFNRNPIGICVYSIGFIALILMNNKRILKVAVPTIVLLFIIGYFGSYNYLIAFLNPRRLTSVLTLFLLIPISIYFGNILNCRALRDKKVIFSIFLFIIMCSFYFTNHFATFNSHIKPLSASMPDDSVNLLKWIISNTPEDSRILIEASSDKIRPVENFNIYGGFIVNLFPYFTNRTYLARAELVHKELKDPEIIYFQEGELNGRPLRDYNQNEFKKIMTEYDLDYIVVWSDDAFIFLENVECVLDKEIFGRLRIYTVDLIEC